MHVAAQAVQLGDDNRSAQLLGGFERRCELRALVESIGAFAGFNLDKLGRDVERFGSGELRDGLALGLQTEARTALRLGRNTVIGNDWAGHFRALYTVVFATVFATARWVYLAVQR